MKYPSPTSRAFALEQDLQLLVKIARRQARKAGRAGITVENVRLAAENAGLLLGSTDRAYKARLYGSVMKRAGLVIVAGRFVRTPRRGRFGGNLVALWRAA